eukprot:XP_001694850.1 predicted protein [Chlamydomonas reinhardtii]
MRDPGPKPGPEPRPEPHWAPEPEPTSLGELVELGLAGCSAAALSRIRRLAPRLLLVSTDCEAPGEAVGVLLRRLPRVEVLDLSGCWGVLGGVAGSYDVEREHLELLYGAVAEAAAGSVMHLALPRLRFWNALEGVGALAGCASLRVLDAWAGHDFRAWPRQTDDSVPELTEEVVVALSRLHQLQELYLACRDPTIGGQLVECVVSSHRPRGLRRLGLAGWVMGATFTPFELDFEPTARAGGGSGRNSGAGAAAGRAVIISRISTALTHAPADHGLHGYGSMLPMAGILRGVLTAGQRLPLLRLHTLTGQPSKPLAALADRSDAVELCRLDGRSMPAAQLKAVVRSLGLPQRLTLWHGAWRPAAAAEAEVGPPAAPPLLPVGVLEGAAAGGAGAGEMGAGLLLPQLEAASARQVLDAAMTLAGGGRGGGRGSVAVAASEAVADEVLKAAVQMVLFRLWREAWAAGAAGSGGAAAAPQQQPQTRQGPLHPQASRVSPELPDRLTRLQQLDAEVAELRGAEQVRRAGGAAGGAVGGQ